MAQLFLITTDSKNKYILLKKRNKYLIIVNGIICEVVGFSNIPIHPKQLEYIAPEAYPKDYQINNTLEKNKFIIYNYKKDEIGHTNKIKDIKIIKEDLEEKGWQDLQTVLNIRV